MSSFIKFCRDRAKLNLTIDIILFLLLMAMAGMGFLIKYNLLSGEKRNAIYGENINLELLGMDRHQWGTIHLIVSIAFVVFILLHIISHWKMVVCFFKRLVPKRTPRIIFSIFISVFGLFLFVFAFVVEPRQVEYGNLYRHRTVSTSDVLRELPNTEVVNDAEVLSAKTSAINSAKVTQQAEVIHKTHPEHDEKQHKNQNTIEEYEVLGSQSISHVAGKYGVPSSYICKELGISTSYQSERLGRLRKRYNFTMSDVSQTIAKFKNDTE